MLFSIVITAFQESPIYGVLTKKFSYKYQLARMQLQHEHVPNFKELKYGNQIKRIYVC